jgi:hypothetical protein
MLFFYHEMMTVLKAYHQSRRESYSHVLWLASSHFHITTSEDQFEVGADGCWKIE